MENHVSFESVVIPEIFILKDISKLTLELFALENDKNLYVLLNKKSLKIVTFKKKGFLSKPLIFFHTKILKTCVEFDKAAAYTADALRKIAFNMVGSMQKTLAKTRDYKAAAEEVKKLFNEIEEDFQGLLFYLKSSSSNQRELFIDRLLKLQEILEKEKIRLLFPLLTYLKLIDEWKDKVETSMQDIFTKDLSEKIFFLQEAGITLSKLIQGKKIAGRWGRLLDIEGKSALFQECADKILQSALQKKSTKWKQEIDLFRAFITLLKKPRESSQFLQSLREAFTTKYEESIDRSGEYLIRLHEEKREIEKRVLLLKLKKEEREGTVENIRRQLHELREKKEIPVPEVLRTAESLVWPEAKEALHTKFTQLVKTIQAINSSQDRALWHTASLLAERHLLDDATEIYLALAGEIAALRRDLMEMTQEVEGYADRLSNEIEFRKVEKAVKNSHKASFVSLLIQKKGERRSVIKEEKMESEEKILSKDSLIQFERSKEFAASLAQKLSIDIHPLYLKKEDLESAFFILASPYMTEGTQGKLPSSLVALREEISEGIRCIQEINSSPLLGLEREKERIRTSLKGLEKVLGPVNEMMGYLKSCQEIEKMKDTLLFLTKRKVVNEQGLKKVEEHLEDLEKDLYALEGIEAVLVELTP